MIDWDGIPRPDRAGERRIEIPVLHAWWRAFGSSAVIEVGAVTPQYDDGPWWPVAHTIIDPRHEAGTFVPDPARHFAGRTVCTISTLEHIGRPDYGPAVPREDDAVAGQALLALVASRHYLLSWPVGYHPALDRLANGAGLPGFTYVQRTPGVYEYVAGLDFDHQFGAPHYSANAVVFVTDWQP